MAVEWESVTAKYPGGEITIRLVGDKSQADMADDLEAVESRIKDLRPAFKAIWLYLLENTRQVFDAEGRPSKWEALKPATIIDRARKGFAPGPILKRSGRLKAALTQRNSSDSKVEIGRRRMRFGVTGLIATIYKVHQLGAPSANIPARPMIVFRRQELKAIRDIIRKYIYTGKV